ncbi:MAG: hypothetical protein A2W90_03350 [Bacteroidetes bacterium GWF2_42_66]|nr:MAG: hypothetical protein A2W92_18265 [Bacteroidetes bacterium GWA2_42_15]OFY02627.1 MAG: hypothetical protein A2W89_22500 [Bacteroidetes bacterium GWE2_42_39]OFY41273.1 MAG: hypothetical protein A2W90_03350 [Bacteroidetes bacterium GWF2_42_66]HBL75538.1 hypothetical protein [Prolixibacteraceae bacterium]HCR89692.1 hypothetical protein [Prolixibacteraceae bacterium]
MKSNLEHIINENREFFNNAEPKEGHFERFGAKLDNEFGRKKKFNIRIVWQAAAAIAFTFLAINQALLLFTPKEQEKPTLASVSPEYGEIETYYVSAINTSLTNWDELQKEGALSAEERSLLEEELKEFDTTFKNLQEELSANPNDERVINAMIEFYQSKLNVITIIIENMKEVKRIKKQSHETEI